MEGQMPTPGLRASVEETIAEEHTAERLGSGDLPVLGTPALLALVERAAVEALRGHLPEGTTSVGARVELDHLAPSPIGARVTATATLEAVEGSVLRFAFEVTDPSGIVARGIHLRVAVDRRTFLERP